MKLVEYKKILTDTGQPINPPWIVVGDLFSNGSLNFLGLVLEENDRFYSIPANVVYISKAELINRLSYLHSQKPFNKKVLVNESMTRVECQTVEDFVNFWYEKNNISDVL